MVWSPGTGRDDKGYQSNHPSNRSSIGNSLHGGPAYKAPTTVTTPDGRSIPKAKPPKTKDNTVNEGFIKNYFNKNPFINAANALSKSKWSTNQNAKRRTAYLEKLKEEDKKEYDRLMGNFSKLNYTTEETVPPSMGFKETNFAIEDDYSTLGQEQALEILGQRYKDTLNPLQAEGGRDGNPYIIPEYAMRGGGADMGSEVVEPYNQFTYDEDAFGPGGQSADVRGASYNFNQGGRIGRAEGGIMELRARRAFGGIMDRVTGRRAYGLGSIFKSVKKAVGKVLKSDVGKIALMAAGAYYMPGVGAKAAGGWGKMFSNAGSGIMNLGTNMFTGDNSMLKKLPPESTFADKAMKYAKWGALGYGLSKTKLGEAQPNEESYMGDRANNKLIDPLTNMKSDPAAMTNTLNEALADAGGDPDKIAAINKAYRFLNDPRLGDDGAKSVLAANGGRISRAEGGLMDLGGMEKDYRAEGGFVPLGEYEKKDDVPARLSVNEFVFTADAVRGAGDGDIDKGAEIMENMMKNLEKGGTVSEESQGNTGAQQMFNISERLGEVV